MTTAKISVSVDEKTKKEVPNQVTIKAIENSENGNDVYDPFDSIEALMDSLNA